MCKRVVILGAVVVALATGVFLSPPVGERQFGQARAELDDNAKDRFASSAAIARIAAESTTIDALAADAADEGVVPGPQAAAPPGFVPAPPLDREPTPPEGYSFASYHEVARGPMTAEDLGRDRAPAEVPGWLAFGDGALADQAAASGRDWSFGWIKLAEGAGLDELRRVLAAHGGKVLGRAGDLVRARLPGGASDLRAIAESPAVVGLGAVPPGLKITETLAERAAADSDEDVPVWITLMSDDPDGRWRAALKELGADVGRFDPAIRTYAAAVPLLALGPISEADFVLAVESIGRVEPTLEISVPSMGADALRSYDAGTGTFVGAGGASVPVGVMDTGLNIGHPDISSNRRSICGANFANFLNPRQDDQDLWRDAQGHGTHVAGIVFGNGAANANRVGMAPLVRDIRFAKAISIYGTSSALSWNRAMDWFAVPTACADGVARKALVINASLGVSSDVWQGRSVVERKIDAAVWENRQLVVTSAGNGADRSLSSMAGAKNALAVGATLNLGDIAAFSSRGPTRDGRLMPKVVGTGVSVASASGAGAGQGYGVRSGTSMASPAVAGVAALVMDAVPELKEEPAALRARLMASAIKPDAFLGDAAGFPLDNTDGPGTVNNVYGLGKASARTAVLSRDDEDGWTGGSAAFDVDADSHAYHDIVVPEGASRLDVVMTWDEPPTETIMNPVLHDLDLWVDRGASCADIAACGHYASRSRIDNVEWVIVPNPPAGVYRLKAVPDRIYGAGPRAGLAWTVIRGDSSPSLEVAVDSDLVRVGPGVPFEIEVTVSSDAYVAAGTEVRVDCRAALGAPCGGLSYAKNDSAVRREDELERAPARDGTSIVVGEIGVGEEQTLMLGFPGRPAGSFRLHVTANSWNARSGDASVAVVVGESAIPAPVRRPPNDDFAMALALDGMGGETTFDLVAATPEPGEPALVSVDNQPVRGRSLWYVWTAPETGLARFAVARAVPDDYSDDVFVDVFRDGPLTGLRRIGDGQRGGGSTFFARAGETYRIRLGTHAALLAPRWPATPDLTLRWGPGSRPGNDDYALAAAIEGESGAVSGNNQGATAEPAEFMGDSNPTRANSEGGWAASVWYRWTAPSTGDYRFLVDRESLAVAAFSGDGLPGARLVSGILRQGVKTDGIAFPATEGVEYRIGVAAVSAYWAATDFTLSWAPGARETPGNDDFAAAAPTTGAFWSGRVAFDDLTVEHGEPVASGVRTAWWSWRAPADGRYTWLVDRRRFPRDGASLRMAVFAGEELDALEVVAADGGDETMDLQLAFDARADTVYRFALGLPRDAAQTSLTPHRITMQWGPTPGNDDLGHARPLAGMGGSMRGSNQFATTEKGERTGTLGDSSLWWTFEPAESAWVRFQVDGPSGSTLAVYRAGADGGLELVRISRRLDIVAVAVRVEAGERYIVRYGSYYDTRAGGGRGLFELTWGASDPPALLRYVDRIRDGQIAADGTEIELGTLGDQAFNGDGTKLYVASPAGIVVFARDPATGRLRLADTLADHPVDPGTQMIWDEAGAALLVAGCDAWHRFAAAEGGGIEHAGRVEGAPCPVGDVLVRGEYVHHVMSPWLIETFRFDDAHVALVAAGLNMIPDVAAAVMTGDGENIYAVVDDGRETSLAAIERDPETGLLRITAIIEEGSPTGADGEGVVEGLAAARALAVYGSHLFVSAGRRGADTLAFDLADRARPVFLGKVPSFASRLETCGHALARRTAAVDVACDRGQFTVQVGGDGWVFGSDLAAFRNADSFGNNIPANDRVQSFAESPDGRHLYVAGTDSFSSIAVGNGNQMLVFERVAGD